MLMQYTCTRWLQMVEQDKLAACAAIELMVNKFPVGPGHWRGGPPFNCRNLAMLTLPANELLSLVTLICQQSI